MFEKKQSLSLGIHIRSKQTKGEAALYCRLYYNGERTTEYRLGLYVPIDAWNQKLKRLNPDHPLAESFTAELSKIKAEHESILLYQKTQQTDFVPTADTIRSQWIAKKPIGPSSVKLIEVYDNYLSYLETLPLDEKKAEKTIRNYQTVRDHLVAFLTKTAQSKLLADAVTPGWGKQFYDYLRTKIAKDTSTRYVIAIRSALSHALHYDKIRHNGLHEFKAPKAQPKKKIVFLRESDLAKLESMPLTGIRKQVRDWAIFMCHTGLDYNDARKVIANPTTYYVADEGGKWVYQRLKLSRAAMWSECHIPVLEKAKQIMPSLSKRNQPKLRVVNKYLNEIGRALGLPFDFSSKVCRKTAGVVFMEEGYTMHSIQKILGHKSLSMTESHYVSIQPSVVDKDTRRIKASNQSNFPQLPKDN